MKLIASMIVSNEADRYLDDCLTHLREFCDGIVAVDDGSTDATPVLLARANAVVHRNETPQFYAHEGRARQKLLELTMAQHPTHILAIDADEFVEDGPRLRTLLETNRTGNGIWQLSMEEVWAADPDNLSIRVDGKWGPWPVPLCFAVPNRIQPHLWKIRDEALACGRVPMQVANHGGRGRNSSISILHFGWTNVAQRFARWHRYQVHDGGRYHRSDHLESIMFPPDRVATRQRPWPAALEPFKDDLLARISLAAPEENGDQPPLDAAFIRFHPDGRWVSLDYDGNIATGAV